MENMLLKFEIQVLKFKFSEKFNLKKIACISISNKTHLVSVDDHCCAAVNAKMQLCPPFEFTYVYIQTCTRT
jgi:hypothetical protein